MSKTVTVMLEIELNEDHEQSVIEEEVTRLLQYGGGLYSKDSLNAIDYRVQMVEE